MTMKTIINHGTSRRFSRRGISSGLGLLACCAVLLSAVCARAVGFRLPNQDPEAIARGNAFSATADNPSAIYYNPAGITQLDGLNVRAGIYFVSAGVDYTSPSGATARPNSDLNPVPQLYVTYSPD